MLLDKENQYSYAQVVTGTIISTNIIDHLVPNTGLGAGEPMAVYIAVGPVTNNTANVVVNLQTATDAAFTSPVVLATKTILAAELVEGAQEYLAINPDFKALRYTRISYTAGASSATINSYLIPQDAQEKYRAFADNVTIAN